ncbi:MAG: prepilin-type N-terminal cleavage/methylation domain-containing protein [Candidatus Omnitrophota bacterium]|nr:MAG: prepilin-type N-terminal cleavage/methylation domain-containing protein [Candidatus Omnitrophota bacterium]
MYIWIILGEDLQMVREGFTLIELLIVVAIIGILAAIAVPNFLNAQLRAKIAGTEQDLKTYVDAMLQYHMDNNSYHAHRDGAAQQFPLTTPVPYLNHFLRDRFQGLPDMNDRQGFEYSFTYYHWIPYSTHQDLWGPPWRRMDPTIDQAHQRGAGLVDGWGPAGIRGGPRYNPTNGLISQGGFFRLVPKGTRIHLHSQ